MEPITERSSQSQWTALPLDLVGDISDRLRAAADLVRFHAVCRPWYEAAPSPAAIRHRFLPWLLNDNLLLLPINLGCISSVMTWSNGHGCDGVPLLRASPSGHKNWVASADGTAAWFLTVHPRPTLTDLVTAATTVLPRFSDNYCSNIDKGMEKSRGMVYPDGTIFLYSFAAYIFTAAILRPGNTAWTTAEKTLYYDPKCHLSSAYHDGKILVCIGVNFLFVLTPDFVGNGAAGGGRLEMWSDEMDRRRHEYSYVFVSRGELMWATVMFVDRDQTYGFTGYDQESGCRDGRQLQGCLWRTAQRMS